MKANKFINIIFAVILVILIASIFGFKGIVSFAAIIILFVLPAYLLLGLAGVKKSPDRTIISFAVSLVYYSLAVWIADRVFHFLWLSIVIVWIAVIGLYAYIRKGQR